MIKKFENFNIDYTFDELFYRLPKELTDACDTSRQSPKYHPENEVTNHIRIVFNLAKKNYPDDKELLLAAIFHDLGKPETQKISIVNGIEKISNYGHEAESLKYIERFFNIYKDVSTDYDKVFWICQNHMRMHLYNNNQLKQVKRELLENHQWFESLKNFSYCDEMRGTIYEVKNK